MITVKQAADAASKYLAELAAVNPEFPITIEEVSRSADGEHWSITLGYAPKAMASGASWSAMLGSREYKIIEVDAKTGDMISMKIRIIKQ